MTTKQIRDAIAQLGGGATPPQIGRLLAIPPRHHQNDRDHLAECLEAMRGRGELSLVFGPTWNGRYQLPDRAGDGRPGMA